MVEKTAAEIEFPISSSTSGEIAVAYAGPAVLANKFIALNTNSGVRLSFCETVGPGNQDVVYRLAVAISYPDAVALRDLLNHQLKSVAFVETPPEAKPQES